MWRSLLSVCPSLYELLSAIFMKFGVGLLYDELLSRPEFRENRFVDSGVLLRGVIERLLLLSAFVDSPVQNSVQIATEYSLPVLSFLKIVAVKGALSLKS
jgi:hypothetical protein